MCPTHFISFFCVSFLLAGSSAISYGYQPSASLRTTSSGTVLQKEYDAAQTAQSTGDMVRASKYYKLFLTDALDHLGNDFAKAGDYQNAANFFAGSLRLNSGNSKVRLDYSRESMNAGDLPKAKQMAEEAVREEPRDASVHLVLGQVLLQMHDNLPAKQQFEAAVALDPNYVNGLALIRASLALKDAASAKTVFEEMRKGFGDSAQLHLDYGLALAETGYLDPAITQFKIAITKDPRLPGAHYSLGAATLQSMGEIDFPQAEADFKKELRISPKDFLSYSQLGYIALSQHRFQRAATYLSKAATLNPQDPDIFLSLGQLYVETKKTAKAEAALRRSIALTRNLSRNHYQVQRAHYLLARLLIETGDTADGQQEMRIAKNLMKKIVVQNQKEPGKNKKDTSPPNIEITNSDIGTTPQVVAQMEAYKKKIAPAIADSYNNLGVIAASAGILSEAIGYFQNAAEWNPEVPGIDYNLGRAAFYGNQFKLAISPLQRYIQLHTDDEKVRKWLVICLYATHDYTGVTRVLQGHDALVSASPGMSAIYAESLIQAGNFDEGMQRLKLLEKSEPQSAEIHRAIGAAYLHQKSYLAAKTELQAALRLDPQDRQAAYDLIMVRSALKNQNQPQSFAPHGKDSEATH